MNNELSLLFCGDIFIPRGEPLSLLSKELSDLVRGHDLASCNFEAPLESEFGIPIQKAGQNLKQSPNSAKVVQEAGFNVINMANNHIYDYGESGLDATLEAFAGLIVVGAGKDFQSAYALKVLEIQGTTVGLLSFCEAEFGALFEEGLDRGGYAWINHHSVNQRVIKAKEKVDLLIVQIHAGAEEVDLPLPEWRQRYKEIVDCGADAIIGHHPHVAQGWELYKEKPIFYSLGNFYFDFANVPEECNRGYAVSLRFAGSKLNSFEVIPIERSSTGVGLCQSNRFRKHIEKLSEILLSPDYRSLANKQALWLWRERYHNYYISALNGAGKRSLKRILIGHIKWLLRKPDQENLLLLLHNIRIETHRWSAQRALSLLLEHR